MSAKQGLATYSAIDAETEQKYIRLELGKMCQVMRSPQMDDGDPEWVVQSYAKTLAKYGLSMVKAACAAALDGRIGNPRFRPSPAEMAVWCREQIASRNTSVASAERTRQLYLSAERPEIDAERRKQVAQAIRSSLQPFLPKLDRTPDFRTEKAQAEMALDANKYAHMPRAKASEYLLKRLATR